MQKTNAKNKNRDLSQLLQSDVSRDNHVTDPWYEIQILDWKVNAEGHKGHQSEGMDHRPSRYGKSWQTGLFVQTILHTV